MVLNRVEIRATGDTAPVPADSAPAPVVVRPVPPEGPAA
jgi:hypothetical protein